MESEGSERVLGPGQSINLSIVISSGRGSQSPPSARCFSAILLLLLLGGLSGEIVESSVGGSEGGIASLRGVQWRIKLEVLPETTSIDELRRAAANGRRKYAELRRRLLVDPHIMEESQKGSDLSMDNPLSQNPGMHELLAPLMYVLNIDVMHLSRVKHLYGDLFNDSKGDLFAAEMCSKRRKTT